jgi:hypothetical protein
MAILRLKALTQLAECITNLVPSLKGKICAGPAEAPHRLAFPHLAINPVRFQYFPDQAAEVKPLGATQVLLNVGRIEGTVQLRLGARTHVQRATLEEQILEVFLQRPGSPGVLVTKVPQCHDAIVAWELDTHTWANEKAFDKKWYSIMTVAAQLPALVTRGSVHTLEEIRLTLTEDLSTPITQVPADEQETVSVQPDGSITVAVGP